MKIIIKVLVLMMSLFLLTAYEKRETRTLNDLLFELSKEFSDCENDDTQLECRYKKQNDYGIVIVFTGELVV